MNELQLYALGGPTRTGKDTTMNALGSLVPGTELFSMDEQVLLPLWSNAELKAEAYRQFHNGEDGLELRLFQSRIDNERWQGDDVWIPNTLEQTSIDPSTGAVQHYLVERHDKQDAAARELGRLSERLYERLRASANGRVAVQGTHITAPYIREFEQTHPDVDVRGLIIINQNDPGHTQEIIDAAHSAIADGEPERNWMAAAGWSDARIRGCMDKTYLMGMRRRTEAILYGIPCRDMGQGDFQENVLRNVADLVLHTAEDESYLATIGSPLLTELRARSITPTLIS